MTTFEPFTAHGPDEQNATPHSIASGVLEYAGDAVDTDLAYAVRVLQLGSRLRMNAHEIEDGEPASPEMDALLIAVSFTDGDDENGEYAAIYRLRRAVDSILAER